MVAGGAKGATMVWVVVLLGLVAGMAGSAAGQGCTSTRLSALVQLVPCRPAVTPFSLVPPSEACCNALRTVGQDCLCLLLNGPPIVGVDRALARDLPAKCAINFIPCDPGV